MVAAFIDSSENLTLGVSPLQNAVKRAAGSAKSEAAQSEINATQNASGAEKPHRGLFGPEGFSFSAFLDIVNPLQHIPVVNSIYRAVTGDTIENGSRIIGGALFGGPIGLVASIINGIVDEETGKDIGSHALAAIGIDDGMGRDTAVGLAQNASPAAVAQNAPLDNPAQNALLENPAQKTRSEIKAIELAETAMPQTTPLGALSALTDRAWAPAQQAAAQPASPQQIPAAQQQMPVQNPAANAAQNAALDERKWFPANTQQGGVVQRSVGAQPVTANSVSQKFGVTRGTAYAGTAANAAANPNAALPAQMPNIPQVPADFAERANAAYQKYMDMKAQQARSGVDRSY